MQKLTLILAGVCLAVGSAQAASTVSVTGVVVSDGKPGSPLANVPVLIGVVRPAALASDSTDSLGVYNLIAFAVQDDIDSLWVFCGKGYYAKPQPAILQTPVNGVRRARTAAPLVVFPQQVSGLLTPTQVAKRLAAVQETEALKVRFKLQTKEAGEKNVLDMAHQLLVRYHDPDVVGFPTARDWDQVYTVMFGNLDRKILPVVVVTRAGRTISGFIDSQDQNKVTITGFDNLSQVIPKGDIEDIQVQSLVPKNKLGNIPKSKEFEMESNKLRFDEPPRDFFRPLDYWPGPAASGPRSNLFRLMNPESPSKQLKGKAGPP